MIATHRTGRLFGIDVKSVTIILVLTSLAACAAPATLAPIQPATPTPPTVTDTQISPDKLIPKPVAVSLGTGTFDITTATTIRVDPDQPELKRLGHYLAAELKSVTGLSLPVQAEAGSAGGIRLTLQGGDPAWGAEGYRLTIAAEHLSVAANQPAGVFYGLQTLLQLVPLQSSAGATHSLPAVTITDYPRLEWRGAMLDVSRHFFAPADVKQYINWLASYKFNRLHLHLSDDQGWRIEIKSWPNLALYGGSTAVSGDPGGYYTQADYADLVKYAQDRYVTIVPEIDLPGHTNAALASYPELNCDGEAPALYTGTEVGFSSVCIDKELTYQFIDDVLSELAAMTPGAYLHVGGDEAHATDKADYKRFMQRVQAIVQSHNKQMIGWQEVMQIELLPTTIAQYWITNQDAPDIQPGIKVIMSPASKSYLDMKYTKSTPLGLQWAGLANEQTAYDWDPTTLIPGVSESNLLGVEAPLWTETIRTLADLEYMVFPRLLGIAEIGWSPMTGRSWFEYKVRLASYGPRLTAAGINFHKSNLVPWK